MSYKLLQVYQVYVNDIKMLMKRTFIESYRKDNLPYNMRALFLCEIRLLQNLTVTTSKFDHLHVEWPTGTYNVMEKKKRAYLGGGVNAERVKTLAFPAIATRIIIILSLHRDLSPCFRDSGFCFSSKAGSLQIQTQ